MTVSEFHSICEEYLINPTIALLCDAVIESIKRDDEELLREAFENSF